MLDKGTILLSVQQVAKELDKSENEIRQWIKEGRLKAEKQTSGRYVIQREDLVVLMPQAPFLPFLNSTRLLTKSQFDKWSQCHSIGHLSESGLLHFDGLYQAINEDHDHYLRFYADGTVLNVSTIKPSAVQQVAQWLGKSHRYVSHGKYKRIGAQIAFTTRYGKVAVDHVGGIVDDGTICLESYSHSTRYRDVKWYHYEQVENFVL